MMRRMGFPVWAVVLAVGAVFALGVLAAEASHIPGTKKHKIVYHFNGSDDGSHVKKASAVLTTWSGGRTSRPSSWWFTAPASRPS